jgi:hypothetical protein
MRLFQYLIGICLVFCPIKWLENFFVKLKYRRFYFSGRVAFFRSLVALKTKAHVLLLPDYICNVLHKAANKAGFDVVTYNTNSLHEPDVFHILDITKKIKKPFILCLAPILGADGGESWITSKKGRNWRSENKVILIFDACQDISRIESKKLLQENNILLISSFNDKSFPGLMGSVVVSDIDDPGYLNFKSICDLKLIKLFCSRVYSYLKYSLSRLLLLYSNKSRGNFEFSHCNKYPYDFHHNCAMKIQISIAVAGLLLRGFYIARKKSYLKRGLIKPIRTPNWLTSPYAYPLKLKSSQLRKKRPYSLPEDSGKSLRPLSTMIHFKGFEDF